MVDFNNSELSEVICISFINEELSKRVKEEGTYGILLTKIINDKKRQQEIFKFLKELKET